MALTVPTSTLRRWQRRFAVASVVFASFALLQLEIINPLVLVGVLLSVFGMILFRSGLMPGRARQSGIALVIIVGFVIALVIIVGFVIALVFGHPNYPLSLEALAFLVSLVALLVSLGGFVITTVFAWRTDRRARLAELRAQQEHEWKKADRLAATCNPCEPEGQG